MVKDFTTNRHIPDPPAPRPDEAREIHPFKVMKAGEDTFADDTGEQVIFSDFRMKVQDADILEEQPAAAPKDLFAPEPAALLESITPPVEITDPTSAPVLAVKDSGTPSPSKAGKPSSSSSQKSGPSEPTV